MVIPARNTQGDVKKEKKKRMFLERHFLSLIHDSFCEVSILVPGQFTCKIIHVITFLSHALTHTPTDPHTHKPFLELNNLNITSIRGNDNSPVDNCKLKQHKKQPYKDYKIWFSKLQWLHTICCSLVL